MRVEFIDPTFSRLPTDKKEDDLALLLLFRLECRRDQNKNKLHMLSWLARCKFSYDNANMLQCIWYIYHLSV